jgi:hypothetical protein
MQGNKVNENYDLYMCRPVKTGEFRLNRWSKSGATINFGINGNCKTINELTFLLAKNKEILVDESCVRAIQSEYEFLRADEANKLTPVTGMTRTEISSVDNGLGFFVMLAICMTVIIAFAL